MEKPTLGITLEKIKEEVQKGNPDFLMPYINTRSGLNVFNLNRVLVPHVAKVSVGYTDKIDGGWGQVTLHDTEGTMLAKLPIQGRDDEAIALVPKKTGDGEDYYNILLIKKGDISKPL